MAPATEELVRQVRELPLGERGAFLDAVSTDGEHDPEFELRGEALLLELKRRSAEIAAGTAHLYTLEEFKARNPIEGDTDD